jgi:outer membrane protein assembly factor BamB
MRRWCSVLIPLLLCAPHACVSPSNSEAVPSLPNAPRPRWIVDVGGPSTSLEVAALTPTVAIVGGPRTLAGLDLLTGRQLWSLPIPFIIPYAGVAVVNARLAAVVSGDGFVSFDPSTGAVVASWVSPRLSNLPSGTTPQRLSDGRILFPSYSRKLIALDAATGRLDTLVTLPGDSIRTSLVSALAVHNDTVYAPVASDSPRGAAFRTTVLYRLALSTRQLDSLARDPSDSSALAPWIYGTTDLLVSSTSYSDPSWLAFDRKTGARRWKVPARAGSLGPSSQAAVVGDTMFAGGNDGRGYVFLLSTGQVVRTFPITEGLVAGVVACGGQLMVNVIGDLAVFGRDGKSRTVVAGLAEGADSFLGGFASGHGAAIIGTGNGKWVAFDCP